MNGYCPSCEKESQLTRITKTENFTIKGETIPVEVDYYECAECGEAFDNPDPAYDPLAAAYAEYRRRKGMVQPQEIRAFREHYGLTQRELSDLLGFGGATLSRYENGALQDETHDTIMRLVMQPQNLLDILQSKSAAIAEEKRRQLIERLADEARRSELLNYLMLHNPHYRRPSALNGFREVNLDRLLNVVKRLCYRTPVYKTKLNKLLFYADFLHFKEYGRSITGLCYVHLPLGPVPDQFERIFAALVDIDPAIIRDEDPALECPSDTFRCDAEPEKGVLTYDEEQIVFRVVEKFKNYGAGQIKDYSHQEEAYRRTQQGEVISYEFADVLRV